MTTGGVLFKVAETLYFLPATIATKVLPMPSMARVPGAPSLLVGVALVDGETVPVVSISDLEGRGSRRPPPPPGPRADNRPLLVCTYLGERVGLVGLVIVACGRFEAAESQLVEHEGVTATPFDVGAVFGKLREHRWAV